LLDRAYGKATQFVAVENDEPSLKDMNLDRLWAGICADLERLFPEYRFVPDRPGKGDFWPDDTAWLQPPLDLGR
jgi:hypothetical protein